MGVMCCRAFAFNATDVTEILPGKHYSFAPKGQRCVQSSIWWSTVEHTAQKLLRKTLLASALNLRVCFASLCCFGERSVPRWRRWLPLRVHRVHRTTEGTDGIEMWSVSTRLIYLFWLRLNSFKLPFFSHVLFPWGLIHKQRMIQCWWKRFLKLMCTRMLT